MTLIASIPLTSTKRPLRRTVPPHIYFMYFVLYHGKAVSIVERPSTSTIRGRRPCREADQAPRTPASRYLGSMNPLGPLALQGSLVVNFIGWHGWPNLRLVIARRRRRCFRLRHRRLHRGWHRRPNLVLAVARTEHLVRWVPQPHRVGRTGPPRHRWTTSKRACSTR